MLSQIPEQYLSQADYFHLCPLTASDTGKTQQIKQNTMTVIRFELVA